LGITNKTELQLRPLFDSLPEWSY